MKIKKAERINKKIRMGLFGPSGSGKTLSALKISKGLSNGDMGKVVVVDTENGSAADYADIVPGYSTLDLEPPYHPQRYINAIVTCEKAGAEVIIIDSISHVWEGAGGCLDMVNQYGGRYQDWAKVTPEYQKLIDKIRYSSAHVICCGRTKQEHALIESSKGKMEVQKLGMGVKIRDGFEYELTTALEIMMNHHALAGGLGKDRTFIFADQPPRVLSEADGAAILEWCTSGRELTQEETQAVEAAKLVEKINIAIKKKQLTRERVTAITGLQTTEGASPEQLQAALEAITQAA